MRETWKPIYDGWYAVSNRGRVKRLAPRRDGVKPGVLRPYLIRNGYARVHLWVAQKYIKVLVHRLVAVAFIGPLRKGAEVNHGDGNKRNNSVWNLSIVSQAENMRHAVESGLHTKGENHGSAKLTEERVRRIRTLLPLGVSAAILAADVGVSVTTIYSIRDRKTWRHI